MAIQTKKLQYKIKNHNNLLQKYSVVLKIYSNTVEPSSEKRFCEPRSNRRACTCNKLILSSGILKLLLL